MKHAYECAVLFLSTTSYIENAILLFGLLGYWIQSVSQPLSLSNWFHSSGFLAL
jgi:hypothetical protein